ncbi:MAG: hypothetical protein JNM63_15930, partial [Spirochaetia bacterium]|nr:hypothetical protein [Spirochaetia bacterium]
REIPEHQLAGSWEASFNLNGSEVRRNLVYLPEGERVYYEVRYDERKRPAQIISHHRSDRLRLGLAWSGERVREITHTTELGIARNPKVWREVIERDDKDAVRLVSFYSGESLTHGESHYRRSNETRILSYFPNGRVRSVSLWISEKDRVFRKEKLLSEKNIFFETTVGKAGSPFADPRITDASVFSNLLFMPYEQFVETDTETIYMKTGAGPFDPGRGERLIRENKKLPRYEVVEAGLCRTQIVLEKMTFNKPDAGTPFEPFFDGFDSWEDYRVHQVDPLRDDLRMTQVFSNGLLRESRWQDGDKSVKTARLEYYPNRFPLREIISLQGKFFSQRVFHSGELPDLKTGKKVLPKVGTKV